MQTRESKKLFTFFSLYIAQSIPMSFFSTVIPVIMRENNFSLITIGLLQLIKLPWILKFLWSPYVDRSTKTLSDYKRWIFTSEIIYALLIAIVALLDYEVNMLLVVSLVICAFIASATQDIATDALAVLSFDKREKSLVNSMQSMGSFAGTMVGGGILLMLFKMVGWSMMLPMLSIFVVVALVPLFFHREEVAYVDDNAPRASRVDFYYFFRQKGIYKQVIFLFIYYSGIIGTLAMVKPWLVDLGYDIKQIGVMNGIVGTAMGFVCSFSAGLLVRRVSRYMARIIFAVVTLLVTLYFVAISTTVPSTAMLYIALMLLWGAYGSASVVVYTMAMDRVREGREGTDFTVQTVITHISGMVMAITAGHLGHWLDYSGLFIFESIVALISLLYVIFVMRETGEKDEIRG